MITANELVRRVRNGTTFGCWQVTRTRWFCAFPSPRPAARAPNATEPGHLRRGSAVRPRPRRPRLLQHRRGPVVGYGRPGPQPLPRRRPPRCRLRPWARRRGAPRPGRGRGGGAAVAGGASRAAADGRASAGPGGVQGAAGGAGAAAAGGPPAGGAGGDGAAAVGRGGGHGALHDDGGRGDL